MKNNPEMSYLFFMTCDNVSVVLEPAYKQTLSRLHSPDNGTGRIGTNEILKTKIFFIGISAQPSIM